MYILRVAAVTLITCGAITDACKAKTTEEWAAVGCTVTDASGVTVAALEPIGAAANWNGCVASKITCSADSNSGVAFTVESGITENTCVAKADVAAWAAVGCVVATSQTATTVAALGGQSAA